MNMNTLKPHRESFANHLLTFKDDQNFTEYIYFIQGALIIFIVSGRLGQSIVPNILQLLHIVSTYVYC